MKISHVEMNHPLNDERSVEFIEFKSNTLDDNMIENFSNFFFELMEKLNLKLDHAIFDNNIFKMNYISDGDDYEKFDDVDYHIVYDSKNKKITSISIRLTKIKNSDMFIDILKQYFL